MARLHAKPNTNSKQLPEPDIRGRNNSHLIVERFLEYFSRGNCRYLFPYAKVSVKFLLKTIILIIVK